MMEAPQKPTWLRWPFALIFPFVTDGQGKLKDDHTEERRQSHEQSSALKDCMRADSFEEKTCG